MAFQQYFNGQVFSPGMQFPDYCSFENCTFYAQTTFGEGCMFVNCTFLMCCYPYYNNPNSIVKKSIMVRCYLEYITIDPETLVSECVESTRAINMGYTRPGTRIGDAKDASELANHCNGVSISPADVGPVAKCVKCGEDEYQRRGLRTSK